jgi:hypothetical protein
MACNACETTFQGSQTLLVTVNKSGSNATLWLQNQGRNIVLVRRILLCTQYPSGGYSVLYLRAPPDPIGWSYPSTYLEPGIGATYYTLTGLSAGAIVQAQAEYIEIEGRARSCATTI